MRQIKFRAWDTADNTMGQPFDFQEFAFEQDTWFSKSTFFMQYTGLKDKNGMEIYESDYLDEKYRWKVTWINGAFYAVSDNPKLDLNNLLLIDLLKFRERAGIPCEVVGNEYEG